MRRRPTTTTGFGEYLKRTEPFGQGDLHDEPRPGRAAAYELLLDEIDLFGVGAAVVNGTLAAPSGRTEGFVVCLPVVDYEILPQGRLCRFAGRVPRGLVSLRIHGGVSLDGAGDFVDDFGIVVVGASDDRYPCVCGRWSATQSPKPASEVVMVGTEKATLSSGV